MFKKHWGYFWLLLASAISFATLLRAGHSGHYDVFTDGALRIWNNEIPYGIPHPSGSFYYSPSAALFFYGAFAWLPYTLGLGAYMLFSMALLLWALPGFLQALGLRGQRRQVFYLLASSEIIGPLLNARIEPFFLALLLFAAADIFRDKRTVWAYFLIATTAAFKQQTLPTAGLLLVWEFLARRPLKPLVGFFGGLVFWFIAPFAVKSPSFVLSCYQSWLQHLGDFGSEVWVTFQHIFRFYSQATGSDVSPRTGQIVSMLVGLGFALWLAAEVRRDADPPRHRILWPAWAFALGGTFTAALSPAAQSAAYILYLPLPALCLMLAGSDLAIRRKIDIAVAMSWFGVSALYSDLVPRSWRLWSFDHALKAPFALGLCLWVMLCFSKKVATPRPSPKL